MKKTILLLALGLLCQPLYPQRTEYPQIGAQVFIEPGQTDKQIDGFFRILAQHGFETARIRMFGAHMLRPDGSWDFTLYDKAFDAAGKHGVKLFATLFPPTDELGDVGGFKFPPLESPPAGNRRLHRSRREPLQGASRPRHLGVAERTGDGRNGARAKRPDR